MSVHQDIDGSLLPRVNAAPRALVFLTVPWSGPERAARSAFLVAAKALAAEHEGLGVECYSMDEEADWCQKWLATLGVPQIGGGIPHGAGSMLWLELGRVVAHAIDGSQLNPSIILSRTRALWAKPPKSDAAVDNRGA